MTNFENEKIDLNEVYVSGGDRATTYSDCDGNTGNDIYDSETHIIIKITQC